MMSGAYRQYDVEQHIQFEISLPKSSSSLNPRLFPSLPFEHCSIPKNPKEYNEYGIYCGFVGSSVRAII